MLRVISSFLLVTGLATGSTNRAELQREDLMEALRAGGYTIVLRHARTDRSVEEPRGTVPKERSDQRNLNAEGIRDAKLMGLVLRKYKIPIAEIVTSPMYRTVETAELAAGKPTSTTMALRVFPATPEQAAVVGEPVKPGSNRLIVTHHFVLETHIPGIKPGDIDEGEAAVIRSNGDGTIELVGRIKLADWQMLAATTGNATTQPGVTANGSAQVVPNTPAAGIALAYVEAFNTGSTARMRSFIESNMQPNPNRTLDERVSSYEGLLRDHGHMTLDKGHEANGNEVILGMKSKRGSFRLIVKASETDPGRVASVSFAVTQGGHN
jgi:phosphohistidine phosphatase SixA